MKLVRSDSPEVTRCTNSAGTRACWNWPALGFGSIANSLGLLIALSVRLIFSTRAAVWLSVPVFLAINGYVVWRVISSRRQWVIAGSAGRVYVRLFAWYRGDECDGNEPDVLVLEGSEIASMSVRTLEMLLDGPKPKLVEWLVIEPAQAVAEDVSKHICPLLRPLDPNKAVYVVNEEGRFNIAWNQWRHAVRVFLQQVVRECPRISIAPEERSELDLNGVWRGISRNLRDDQNSLSAQDRQKLVQAMRLGFGCNCTGLLSRYKNISFQNAAAYLAEIEREETGRDHSVECSSCRF